MNWQEIISILIVGIAFFLTIRSGIKKHRLKKILPCAGDCNCGVSKIALLKNIKRN